MHPHVQAAALFPTLATTMGCKSVCQPVTDTTIPLPGGCVKVGGLVLHTQEQQWLFRNCGIIALLMDA